VSDRAARRERPAPPPRPRLAHVVAFSIAATTIAAIVTITLHVVASTPFLVPFIVLRWCVVFALCGTVAVTWLAPRLPLPGVLRTPLTPLLLTCESILIDIVGAQLH
jgi:hypothetical protein